MGIPFYLRPKSKQRIQVVQFNLLENLFHIGKTSYSYSFSIRPVWGHHNQLQGMIQGRNPLFQGQNPLAQERNPLAWNPLARNPLARNPLAGNPLAGNPLARVHTLVRNRCSHHDHDNHVQPYE